MNTPENNLITVFTSREISSLYKTFLELVEDLKKDHSIMLEKIKRQYGDDFINNVDSFPPEKFEQIRKRVLDSGNECSRRIVSFLDFFDFVINKEKLEEAAKQKRQVVKKVIVSPPISIQ